jgi:hypothetical protein
MDLDIKKFIQLVEDIKPLIKDNLEKSNAVPMLTITITPNRNQLKISLGASIKVFK